MIDHPTQRIIQGNGILKGLDVQQGHESIPNTFTNNMLRDACGTKSCAPNYEPDPTQEPPTDNFINIARARGFADYEAFAVRDSFAAYFSNDGRVSWQDHIVNRTDRN